MRNDRRNIAKPKDSDQPRGRNQKRPTGLFHTAEEVTRKQREVNILLAIGPSAAFAIERQEFFILLAAKGV
jgi:hypothetical protein